MKRLSFLIAVALAVHAGTDVWTPLGPYGASVGTLVADPRSPGTLYAGTGYGGGLYKTTDGGANWTLLNPELGPAYLAIDPQNTNTIYAGVGGSGDSGAWMFKSTDGGASFNLSNSGLQAVGFYGALTVDPVNSGTVYAVSIVQPCVQSAGCLSTQVIKSTNGGAHWSVVSSGLPASASQITALAVDPQDSNVLYAGVYGPKGVTSGIFKSTNGGISWSPLNLSFPVCCRQALVIDPFNRDTLYAANSSGIVKVSASAGTILNTTALSGGTIISISIDQPNPGTVYAATAGSGSFSLFKSSDGGINWMATANASQIYGSIGALALDTANSGTVYAGTSYGVVKTIDGGASWANISHGIRGINVESVTVDPQNSGTLYAIDNANRISKTTDGGKNWTPLQGFPPALPFSGPVTVDSRDSNTLYTVTYSGLWKSVDGGASWNETGAASLAAAGALGTTGGSASDRQNPGTLYLLAGIKASGQGCCAIGVFESTDGAASWAMKGSLQGNSVTLLVMDPQNSSTLYGAGTYRSTISKSTDGGVTWNDSLLPPEAFTTEDDDSWAIVKSLAVCAKCYTPYAVQSLVVDPQRSTLYAISTGGILRSRDGGSSWISVNDGLAGTNTLAMDPSNPSTLYAGGAGVYITTVAPEIRPR
jgi:photosystem II stability/assembly factor-like uncharacterized protein